MVGAPLATGSGGGRPDPWRPRPPAAGSGGGRLDPWRAPPSRGGSMAGALPDSGSREVSSFVETNASAAVRCWGLQGSAVQAGLANATAAPYLAAGASEHAPSSPPAPRSARARTTSARRRTPLPPARCQGTSSGTAWPSATPTRARSGGPTTPRCARASGGPPPPCTSRRSGSPSSSSSPAATSRAASRPAPVIWSVGKLGSIFRKNEFSSVERFS